MAGQSVSKISHVTSKKMREMRVEVGKKTPKKEVDNPSFLRRHNADFLRNFVQLHKLIGARKLNSFFSNFPIIMLH